MKVEVEDEEGTHEAFLDPTCNMTLNSLQTFHSSFYGSEDRFQGGRREEGGADQSMTPRKCAR